MGRVTVIVDGVPVEVWGWARWRDAYVARYPRAGGPLARGETWLEDACGNPVDLDGTVVDGATIVVRSSSER